MGVLVSNPSIGHEGEGNSRMTRVYNSSNPWATGSVEWGLEEDKLGQGFKVSSVLNTQDLWDMREEGAQELLNEHMGLEVRIGSPPYIRMV